MSQTWPLSSIRNRYRELTKDTTLSDSDINDIINDYYQNQFPFDVDDNFFSGWLTQKLSATDSGIYDINESVLVIKEPIKINGEEQIFTMDYEKFFQQFDSEYSGAFVIDNAGSGLEIGTTSASAVKNGNAFDYNISGNAYSEEVDTETELSGDTVPQSKYGAWRLEIDADGTVSIQEADDNSTGYATPALAMQGLPDESSIKAPMGYVTAINTSGTFTPGTTELSSVGVTATYTDGWNSNRSTPSWVLLFDQQLYVGAKSDDIRELKAPYTRKPTALSTDTSTPEDVRWGEAIAYGAAISRMVGDVDGNSVNILPKFKDLIRKINAKFARQRKVTRVPKASF